MPSNKRKSALIKKSVPVYVVTSSSHLPGNDDEHLVVGTYLQRGKAIDACARYIVDRLDNRDDMAFVMANDQLHRMAESWFTENEDGYTVLKEEKTENFLRHLRDYLGSEGCYVATNRDTTFRFDVDETDIDGVLELHTAVVDIAGDENQFPEPHTFYTYKELEKWAIAYVTKYVSDAQGPETTNTAEFEKALNEFRSNLNDMGLAQWNVRDDLVLNMIVWTHCVRTYL